MHLRAPWITHREGACLTLAAVAVALAALASTAAKATPVFAVTYEAAGVQSANTASLCAALGSGTCTVGTETFNARPAGTGKTFTTDYGTGGVITGTYTGVNILPADQYGGAGGTGNYAVTSSSAGYSLSLSTTLATGVNYFGFWLSALDPGNVVTFYDDGTQAYQFTPTNLLNLVGNCPNAYCGNPTSAYRGQDGGQPYVFVNFFDEGGSFDRISFAETPMVGGYESDNHTVGYVTGTSGTPIPEPASLALLGAGVIGLGVLRRHRTRT